MKRTLITLLLIIFFKIFAIAQGTGIPSGIGNVANYKYTQDGYEFSVNRKVLSFDAKTKIYTIENITTIGTEVTTNQEALSDIDYLDIDTIDMTLAFCETYMVNGKLETVTVPAGTFETCVYKDAEGGVIKLAMVPFGIVKYESKQVNVELVSYTIAE